MKKQRVSKADVTRAIASVQERGLKVERVEIDGGKVVIFAGEGVPPNSAYEAWKAKRNAPSA